MPGYAPPNHEEGGFHLGISLASHPADAERMETFRDAARR
jgi:hypothetical protein